MNVLFSRHRDLEEHYRQACAAFQRSRILTISGPSGSGKTHTAKKIHERELGAKAAFVSQDTASLAESRFESQVFGHVKGAFSGAVHAFPGLLGAAGHGTLCLEGLEDLSLENQARMLRFVQERTYRSLGSTVDSRYEGYLVFTSRKPLAALHRQGLLREDFFFRISGFELQLPPVHERLLDFEDLLQALKDQVRKDLSMPGEHSPCALGFPAETAVEGNLHGLRNMVEQALIRGVSLAEIAPATEAEPFAETELPNSGSLKGDLYQLEARLLNRALRLFPDSRKRLAAHLGISTRSLMYKLKEHGLK